MNWTLELWLQLILPAIASGAVTWGVLKTELRYIKRSIVRAHKRLDLIGAPNVTLENGD